jgi:hypothetical protein
MLGRCVVDHQINDNSDAALVCGFDKLNKILHRAEIGVYRHVIGGVNGHHPNRVRAQGFGYVVQLLDKAAQVAYAVAVAVVEGADEYFVYVAVFIRREVRIKGGGDVIGEATRDEGDGQRYRCAF